MTYVQQIKNIDIEPYLEPLKQTTGLYEFIKEHAYLAGGAVRDLIRNKTPKDFDFFFRTEEAAKEFAEKFGKQFKHTPFANYEGRYYVPKLKYDRPYQFIMMYSGAPKEVVGQFDWNINMVWIDPTFNNKPGTEYVYVEDFMSLNVNATHKFSAMERLGSFLSAGYRISPTEMQRALVIFNSIGPINSDNIPQTFSASNSGIQYVIENVKRELMDNSKLSKYLGTNRNMGIL